MNTKLRKIGEFYIVDLPHNIFMRENANKLNRMINNIIFVGIENILLNLTKVQKIDGIGLGALLNLQKVALYHNVNIRLYGLQPDVQQMLYQTNLNRVFGMCNTRDNVQLEQALRKDVLIA